MHYEITNTVLFDLFDGRGDWRNPWYWRERDEATDQERVGHLVQPGVVPPRGDRRGPSADGEREAAGRCGDDVRPVADQFDRAAAEARWSNCDRKDCNCSWHNTEWKPWNLTRCLDRQRAGECPALAGGDRGPEPGRDARPGGAGGDTGGPGAGGGGGYSVTCSASERCTKAHRLCRDYIHDWCMASIHCGCRLFYCSRPPGHDGDHVACSPSINEHNLATWPQEAL